MRGMPPLSFVIPPVALPRRAWLDLRPLDRRLLEDTILAAYAARRPRLAVLSVGVRSAQRHYERLLPGHRYITADVDPACARYGSLQGHAVACASRLGEHFDAGSFDLVILNGVLGWGLDDAATAERALGAIHRLLRSGGELLLGWNDRPGRRPFMPAALQAMRGFEPKVFAPLGCSSITLPGRRRHRYEFFLRHGDPG